MRTKTLLVGLMAVTLTFTASSYTSVQDDEPTPLQQAMGTIRGGQKALGRGHRNPVANKAALLRAATAIEEGALKAFSLAPPAPEGENVNAWRIGYQRQMLQLLDAALECEAATYAGDAEALAAAYGRLGQAKKGGHNNFKQ